MNLHLNNRWGNLRVGYDVRDLLGREVAHANGVDQTLGHERLHGLPGLPDGGLHCGSNVARVGPVDQQQVEVGDPEVFQNLLHRGPDALLAVVVVPQLGGEEDVLSLHHALREHRLQGLADLVLVVIVLGAVHMPVPCPQSVQGGLLDLPGLGLPGSEPDERDLPSIVEGGRGDLRRLGVPRRALLDQGFHVLRGDLHDPRQVLALLLPLPKDLHGLRDACLFLRVELVFIHPTKVEEPHPALLLAARVPRHVVLPRLEPRHAGIELGPELRHSLRLCRRGHVVPARLDPTLLRRARPSEKEKESNAFFGGRFNHPPRIHDGGGLRFEKNGEIFSGKVERRGASGHGGLSLSLFPFKKTKTNKTKRGG